MSLNFLYDLRLLRYEFFKKARFFENWKNVQKFFLHFSTNWTILSILSPTFFFEIFLWKNTLQHLKNFKHPPNTFHLEGVWFFAFFNRKESFFDGHTFILFCTKFHGGHLRSYTKHQNSYRVRLKKALEKFEKIANFQAYTSFWTVIDTPKVLFYKI